MEFNVYFDITSLLFLFIVIWRYMHQRQFPLRTNLCFFVLLLIGAANILLDIAGSVSLEYIEKIPLWICYTLNALYFVLQLALPAALVVYLMALIKPSINVEFKAWAPLLIPAGLCELTFLATLPLGLVFSITKEAGYARGPLKSITYINFAIYVVIALIICARSRRYLTKDVKASFLMLIVLEVAAAGFQFAFPQLLLSGTAVAASLAIMFFVIQNPEYMVDPITRLFNYNAFLLLCNEMIINQKQFKMVSLDLHGLRRVNTLYGMGEGDRMLRQISDYLSDEKKCWVFRTGETRFTMLTTDNHAYMDYLGRVMERQTMCWPVSTGDTLQMSFTVCHLRHAEQFSTVEEMLNVVDLAMQEQKKNGEVIFSIDRNARANFNQRTEIETAVRESLQTGECFKIYYQPIYSCIKHRFNGAEALLRFNHPELGPVSPALFIPIAAQSGLMARIDEMVINKVFDDICSGLFERLNYEHIHINLSAASFATEEMINKIMETAEAKHVDPHGVSIEITETIASASTEEFGAYMKRLKEVGFCFSLDDFGTGYSNITRLLSLPFDQVKLDKSLLDDSVEAFVEIARMIKKMKWGLVAEGVETAAQAKLVEEAGVSAIQGYYYAKPMPVPELGAYSGRSQEFKGAILQYKAR